MCCKCIYIFISKKCIIIIFFYKKVQNPSLTFNRTLSKKLLRTNEFRKKRDIRYQCKFLGNENRDSEERQEVWQGNEYEKRLERDSNGKTTLYNWDCRRVDELSHNEVSSLGFPRAILVFSSPFPLSPFVLLLFPFFFDFFKTLYTR